MKNLKRLIKILGICIGLSIVLIESNAKINNRKVQEYISEFSFPASVGYNYTHLLNDEERVIYEKALENIKAGKLTTYHSGLSSDSVERVAYSVLSDHPEFFWLKHMYNAGYRSFNFQTYSFWGYTTNPEKYTDIFKDSVDSHVAEVNSYNSNDEKIRFLHDKLVRNITYNHPAAKESPFMLKEYQFAGTAYGALVDSSAVCAGYAKAFQIILNKCGYDCGYVTGKVDAGLHAWNELYLNDRKYCFDVTWDDMGDYYEYPEDLRYTYFALYPEEMAKDHLPDKLYQGVQ